MKKLLLTATILACSIAHAQDKKRVTSTDAAKKVGLEIQKTLDADVDGDGKKELLAICNAVSEKGGMLTLASFGEDENGYVLKDRQKLGGKEFKKFELAALIPPAESSEVVIEVYDDNPDDKVKRVQVFTGVPRLREIFKSTIFRPKDKDAREDWERDPDVVQYGDARPGWYFADLEKDGLTEVVIRRRPKVIEVPKGDKKAKIIVGVVEEVWSFDGAPDAGTYVKRAAERFSEFIPSYQVTGVEASSVWVEPTVLKDLKAQALSEAASNAAAGKGKTEAEVDVSSFILMGADKNLETAWIEDAKNHGKGEWLEVKLDAQHEIHMVRVVPGCVADKGAYSSHNIPETFDIQLGSGARTHVDTKKIGDPERPAIAVQAVAPDKNRPWAKNYLVYFDGKDTASSVKIFLDSAKKQGKSNRTCISEVSVH